MISIELYRQGRPTVLVERSNATSPGAWARLQEALARGVLSGSNKHTVVHADVFLAELEVLRELRRVFDERLELGSTLKAHLKSMAADRQLREMVVGGNYEPADLDSLENELRAAGFSRTLLPFQLEILPRVLKFAACRRLFGTRRWQDHVGSRSLRYSAVSRNRRSTDGRGPDCCL